MTEAKRTWYVDNGWGGGVIRDSDTKREICELRSRSDDCDMVAASPEMLDALEIVAHDYEWDTEGDGPWWVQVVRAAIAKAKGQAETAE